MLEIQFDVHGLDELDKALGELDVKTAGKALRSALMFATTPMLKAARDFAPEDPFDEDGHVKDALGRRTTIQKNGIVKMRLGEREKAPKLSAKYRLHGHFLELGTRKMSARPFLRPAAYAKALDTIERFRKKLKERIEKASAP